MCHQVMWLSQCFFSTVLVRLWLILAQHTRIFLLGDPVVIVLYIISCFKFLFYVRRIQDPQKFIKKI